MAEPQVHTLLLRLVGPMQSWGTSSRYSERDSGSEPSKSGVVGILAAALGRSRSVAVDDLAALRMGVRVDREGVPGYDFQTASAAADDPGIATASDTPQASKPTTTLAKARSPIPVGGRPSISRRHFLHDAAFLVGLEGTDLGLLQELDRALLHPVFAIGLGRRGYVPSLPLALPNGGIRPATGLIDALEHGPWPIDVDDERPQKEEALTLRGVIESSGDEQTALRLDQPVGAAFSSRTFGLRPVHFTYINPKSTGGNTQ